MTPANDNIHFKFTQQHCVVLMHNSVLMFDRLFEAERFINDYFKR